MFGFFLYEQYLNHWIEREESILWPLRSLNLNPFHYYLWEYVKDAVYREASTMKLDLTEIQKSLSSDNAANIPMEL